VLRLTGVTKRFGQRSVFQDVSLDVAAGDYIAIVGDSGIGKSTLLNLVAGLEPADSGLIVFNQMKLSEMHDDALTLVRREQFGFVFQAFHILPHLTVEQNVGLPLLLREVSSDEIVSRSRKILERIGNSFASVPRNARGCGVSGFGERWFSL
jgi:putative ABC transport system ATP-binding protein